LRRDRLDKSLPENSEDFLEPLSIDLLRPGRMMHAAEFEEVRGKIRKADVAPAELRELATLEGCGLALLIKREGDRYPRSDFLSALASGGVGVADPVDAGSGRPLEHSAGQFAHATINLSPRRADRGPSSIPAPFSIA